jgi:hypothetical protein
MHLFADGLYQCPHPHNVDPVPPLIRAAVDKHFERVTAFGIVQGLQERRRHCVLMRCVEKKTVFRVTPVSSVRHYSKQWKAAVAALLGTSALARSDLSPIVLVIQCKSNVRHFGN